MQTDAIVNTANNDLQTDAGLCGAIFAAAGVKKLKKACSELGYCETGDVVITDGFSLPSKYIIHTVGPVWRNGGNNEQNLLYMCYKNSLILAKKNDCESIAFPLISSSDGYNYPNDQALRVAINAIGGFLLENDMMVSLVIRDDIIFSLSGKLHSVIQTYINDNYTETNYEKISQSDFEALRSAATSHLPSNTSKSPGLFDLLNINKEKSYTGLAGAKKETDNKNQEKFQRHIEDILSQVEESFSQMLLRLIDEKNKRDADIYNRANVHKSVFSRIRSNPNYKANKSTVLAFAIALELSLDVTHDLLKKAGYALSSSSKQDLIVSYYIKEGIYDIFQINETLFLYEQSLLGV